MKKHIILLSILTLIFALSGCSLINDDKNINEVKERTNNAFDEQTESNIQIFQDGDEPNNPTFNKDYAQPQYTEATQTEQSDVKVRGDNVSYDDYDEGSYSFSKNNELIPKGFIVLHNGDGDSYYVNIQNILYFSDFEDNTHHGDWSIIRMIEGRDLIVKETAFEISELINGKTYYKTSSVLPTIPD